MIKLTKDIIMFTNLFDNLDKLFNRLEFCDWSVWGRNNNDPNYRIGVLTYIKYNQELFNAITTATRACIHEYTEELDIDYSLYFHDEDGIYIRKWDYPMQGMNAHRDYTYDNSGDTKRVEYTLCGYLNDDYEGGLLEFPEHNLSIKPPAGSAIVFPAHELHLVTDVVDKHRYMWSTFVFSK